ncbi:hypothetical protein K2173_023357 [Erythroxylum novogranatense]|uniref:S-acyltransferase n=1 Tax=Erythroxylum novogranatense TaxID=1862640 RepID=A0AAV8TVV7_9ROSI|nr:hypothetical protein K2173_023357 [Erythroxylum novogranatense]
MSILSMCQNACNRALDRCYRAVPCLADPARRSSLGLKAAFVILHVLYVGILFLFDSELVERTKQEPWYTAVYLLLFSATLVQYFATSGSSPGYVLDAMRALNESNALRKSSMISKQPASSKSGCFIIDVDQHQPGRDITGRNLMSWTKLVLDMYPPGTSVRSLTCSYCNTEQPPRTKHCHDCDKCVLQFDHHCVWLGTCVGLKNHCRFWWYILEETALCLWTGILYIEYLKASITRVWWKGAIMILLLVTLSISLIFLLLLLLFHSYLILTNQTTYELVRRRRIPYLRGIPERVFPFSKGVCQNIYNFCCGQINLYNLERLPTALEIEEKSRPYTCLDFLTCRCC